MNWNPRNGVGIRVLSIMLFFFFMVTNGSEFEKILTDPAELDLDIDREIGENFLERNKEGYEEPTCKHCNCDGGKPVCDGFTEKNVEEKFRNAKNTGDVEKVAEFFTNKFGARTKQYKKCRCVLFILMFLSTAVWLFGLHAILQKNSIHKNLHSISTMMQVLSFVCSVFFIAYIFYGVRENKCERLTKNISLEKTKACKKFAEISNVEDIYIKETIEFEEQTVGGDSSSTIDNTPPSESSPTATEMNFTYSATKEVVGQENESNISEGNESPALEDEVPKPVPTISKSTNVQKPVKSPEEKKNADMKTDSKNYAIDIVCMVIGILFVFALYAYINMEELNIEEQIV